MLEAPARIELVAKPQKSGGPNIAADPVVSGGVDIIVLPADAQLVSLGEDWRGAGLLALFADNRDYLTLWGQFRWRNGAVPDAPWAYSLFFAIEVQNCLFPDAFIPPGAVLVGAPEYYMSGVDAYIGSATALEAIPGTGLANLSLVKAIIGGAASEWRVIKPATEATNVDAGIIRLLDGTAHLERVAGL